MRMNRRLLKALLAIAAATTFHSNIPAAVPLVTNIPQLAREYSYPSYTALQGRRHPAYQVFAYNTPLPGVTVLDDGNIVIDGVIGIESRQLHRISWRQREAIAFVFDVPQGVVDYWLASLLNRAPLDGETIAKDLCATVMDHKYLAMRFVQYLPPAGMQSFKDIALETIDLGDLAAGWRMYYSLPRPGMP